MIVIVLTTRQGAEAQTCGTWFSSDRQCAKYKQENLLIRCEYIVDQTVPFLYVLKLQPRIWWHMDLRVWGGNVNRRNEDSDRMYLSEIGKLNDIDPSQYFFHSMSPRGASLGEEVRLDKVVRGRGLDNRMRTENRYQSDSSLLCDNSTTSNTACHQEGPH